MEGWSAYGEAMKVINEFGLVLGADGTKKLKEKQIEKRQYRLRGKVVHGKYYKELEQPSRNLKDCTLWLRKTEFSARTESVIIAAQDGVLLTRGYKNRIFKAGINANCRNGLVLGDTDTKISISPISDNIGQISIFSVLNLRYDINYACAETDSPRVTKWVWLQF